MRLIWSPTALKRAEEVSGENWIWTKYHQLDKRFELKSTGSLFMDTFPLPRDFNDFLKLLENEGVK